MKVTALSLYLVLGLTMPQLILSQSIQDRLLGKWVLVNTSGGITGRGFPIKRKTVIEFTPECRFNLYKNDSLTSTKAYYIETSIRSYYSGGSRDMLILGNYGWPRQSISIHTKKLILRQEGADGLIKVYRKLSPEKANGEQ